MKNLCSEIKVLLSAEKNDPYKAGILLAMHLHLRLQSAEELEKQLILDLMEIEKILLKKSSAERILFYEGFTIALNNNH